MNIGARSEESSGTHQTYGTDSRGSLGESSLLVIMYNAAEAERARRTSMLSTARPSRQGSRWLGLLKGKTMISDPIKTRHMMFSGSSLNRVSSVSGADENLGDADRPTNGENHSASQTSARENQPSSGLQSITEQSSVMEPSPATKDQLNDFTTWSRLYLFGTKQPSVDSDQQESP